MAGAPVLELAPGAAGLAETGRAAPEIGAGAREVNALGAEEAGRAAAEGPDVVGLVVADLVAAGLAPAAGFDGARALGIDGGGIEANASLDLTVAAFKNGRAFAAFSRDC